MNVILFFYSQDVFWCSRFSVHVVYNCLLVLSCNVFEISGFFLFKTVCFLFKTLFTSIQVTCSQLLLNVLLFTSVGFVSFVWSNSYVKSILYKKITRRFHCQSINRLTQCTFVFEKIMKHYNFFNYGGTSRPTKIYLFHWSNWDSLCFD